jgi:hypothetical protein
VSALVHDELVQHLSESSSHLLSFNTSIKPLEAVD